MGVVVNVNRDQVQQALRIYWKHAWPVSSGACPALPDWADLNMNQILGKFVDESDCSDHACHRFVLRLGNYIYPHMKFAVEQCIRGGDFYFLADCHDDALAPQTSDIETWKELRSRNYSIKLAIESDWKRKGLPTFLTASKRATGSFKKPKKESARHILVVDDEPANCALTGAMLRAEGFGIESAGSGTEALQRANQQKPDLVVTDYEMPGMSGREFAEQFKSNEETREIPILICTYAEVTEADLRPADALLRRPFSQEDLKSTVDRLLQRRSTS
ncbi:MAG: response regulator [Planctomycetes bacterium]|nr:response regulator [Planctomycetota bacterium]